MGKVLTQYIAFSVVFFSLYFKICLEACFKFRPSVHFHDIECPHFFL